MSAPRPEFRALRIVSGGQSGVDRAALDFALAHGFACGGWCPRDRHAEDGPIPSRYPLRETDEEDYAVRTRRNVEDADATLICALREPLSGGTALTREFAQDAERPCLVVTAGEPVAAAGERVRAWLVEHGVGTLNVAGPRASGEPGAYALTRRVLGAALLPEKDFVTWWLLPEPALGERVAGVIRELAARFPRARPFAPHLTLGARTGPVLAPAAEDFAGLGAVELKGRGVHAGDQLKQTLFVRFPETPALGELAARTSDRLGCKRRPMDEPHASLLYAILQPEEWSALCAEYAALGDGRWRFTHVQAVRASDPFTEPEQAAHWEPVDAPVALGG